MYGSGSKQALIGAPGCKSLLIDQGVNKLWKSKKIYWRILLTTISGDKLRLNLTWKIIISFLRVVLL